MFPSGDKVQDLSILHIKLSLISHAGHQSKNALTEGEFKHLYNLNSLNIDFNVETIMS